MRNMGKKIVFFDVDGTLLNDQNQIPESTKRAIRLLQEKGIYTAIATGRAPRELHRIVDELNIRSYVSINGQYVVFEGATVFANPMDIGQMADIAGVAGANGHALVYCSNDEVRATEAGNRYIETSLSMVEIDYPPVDEEFYRRFPIYQGNLFITREEQSFYEKRFPHYKFVRWHEYAVDFLPREMSKARGIERMLQILGIANENCFAFGDGLNDVEMLSAAGVGIAMGNAVAEAKAAANIVTTSNGNDGIYNGLMMAGLLDGAPANVK